MRGLAAGRRRRQHHGPGDPHRRPAPARTARRRRAAQLVRRDAIANGIDPGLPALYERPAGPPTDLVLLQEYLADHHDDENDGTYDDGWVQSLVRELKRSIPPGALLGLVLDADNTVLQLRLLRVSLGHRGQGHATRVLARVCAEADARGLVVACTPTDEFGADYQRLEGFYRRFGFTPVAPTDRLTEHTWQRPASRPAPGGGAA